MLSFLCCVQWKSALSVPLSSVEHDTCRRKYLDILVDLCRRNWEGNKAMLKQKTKNKKKQKKKTKKILTLTSTSRKPPFITWYSTVSTAPTSRSSKKHSSSCASTSKMNETTGKIKQAKDNKHNSLHTISAEVLGKALEAPNNSALLPATPPNWCPLLPTYPPYTHKDKRRQVTHVRKSLFVYLLRCVYSSPSTRFSLT